MINLNIQDTYEICGAQAWHEKTPQYTALIVTGSSLIHQDKLTMLSDRVTLASHTIHSGHTGSFTFNSKTTYVYPYLDLQGQCIGSIYINI